jgi:hypothetical protein
MPVPRAYWPLLPLLPTCFGRNRPRNKALYRNFGITQRNELKLEPPAAIAA